MIFLIQIVYHSYFSIKNSVKYKKCIDEENDEKLWITFLICSSWMYFNFILFLATSCYNILLLVYDTIVIFHLYANVIWAYKHLSS